MFNNVALDVFIGLVFVFLLYSLLASIVQEMIATRLAFRAKVLEKAILRMLEDTQTDNHRPFGDRIDGFLHLVGLKNLLKNGNVAPWFYAHPLIKYLGEDNYYSKPAYIDASNFSKVMIDLLKDFNLPESQTLQSIHNSITNGIIHKLPINIAGNKSDKLNPAIKILQTKIAEVHAAALIDPETVSINPNTALFLQSLWRDAGADINVFRTKLEDWFNDTMDRASGWYKKYTRMVLLIIGLVVAYVFNVDTIAIHKILSTNKPARDQLVQMAIKEKDNLNPANYTSQSDSILKATYQMVAKDANDANDVLGLGTPWRDTCKMCKDSLKCGSFIARFDSLKKVKIAIADTITILNASLREYNDSLKGFKLNGDSSSVQEKIATDSEYLRKYQSYSLPEYDRMLALRTRCEFIRKARDGKWNLYSPNQTGGWETLLGWIIAALAITLGAPFWFDLLSKLISLRGAGTISTTDDTSSNTKNTTTPAAPLAVTINTNPGEEAVG